jgi:hypothetical protein
MTLGGVLTTTLTTQISDRESSGAVAFGTLARYHGSILTSCQASISELFTTSSTNRLVVTWALAFLAWGNYFIVALSIALIGELLSRCSTDLTSRCCCTTGTLVLTRATTRSTTRSATTSVALFNNLLEAILVFGNNFTTALGLTFVGEMFTRLAAYWLIFIRAVTGLFGALGDNFA